MYSTSGVSPPRRLEATAIDSAAIILNTVAAGVSRAERATRFRSELNHRHSWCAVSARLNLRHTNHGPMRRKRAGRSPTITGYAHQVHSLSDMPQRLTNIGAVPTETRPQHGRAWLHCRLVGVWSSRPSTLLPVE
jgi:hypothetical protein